MELTRAQLFEQIWSEPMGKVAERFGLTGNGLAKICDRLDIPRPARSHWTRSASLRDLPPELPPPPIGLSEVVALGRRQLRQSPGNRMRLDSDSRRKQLQEVAATIAQNEGLSALTIRRLAREVQISPTQVHNCFGGRTDLLIAMARDEITKLEVNRRAHFSRNVGRHMSIVLSTIGYLHEAAERGPLLQMLLRVPEVKQALKDERSANNRSRRDPSLKQLIEAGRMDIVSARAATGALMAVSLKAGGIVAGKRAPLAIVEQLCLAVLMAGVASNDQLARDKAAS